MNYLPTIRIFSLHHRIMQNLDHHLTQAWGISNTSYVGSTTKVNDAVLNLDTSGELWDDNVKIVGRGTPGRLLYPA